MDTESTKVIFRKWNKSVGKNQGIIAIFPEDVGTMSCYTYNSLVYLGEETGTGLVHQTYYGYTKREALALFREYVQSVRNQDEYGRDYEEYDNDDDPPSYERDNLDRVADSSYKHVENNFGDDAE